jgi:hypothetical protein
MSLRGVELRGILERIADFTWRRFRSESRGACGFGDAGQEAVHLRGFPGIHDGPAQLGIFKPGAEKRKGLP